jgi:hypothetical protein
VDIKKTREKRMLESHERNRGEPKNPLHHKCGAMSVAEHNFKTKTKNPKK